MGYQNQLLHGGQGDAEEQSKKEQDVGTWPVFHRLDMQHLLADKTQECKMFHDADEVHINKETISIKAANAI